MPRPASSPRRIETPGAVRTVVRIEGSVTARGTELLRFIIRLTFFAGQATVQVTQTLLFQDAAKDRIIKGIGLRLDRSLSGDLLNRRVSIAGDTAVYTEPVQSLYTRPFSGDNPDYARQLAGQAVAETPETAELFAVGRQNAVWSAFRVTQESEDYFRLEKQTKAKLLPVRMGKGHRSQGLLYAGDTTGGVAVTLRGFWQKYPGRPGSGRDGRRYRRVHRLVLGRVRGAHGPAPLHGRMLCAQRLRRLRRAALHPGRRSQHLPHLL